jgi:hypothetical protein
MSKTPIRHVANVWIEEAFFMFGLVFVSAFDV